jgi:hypothetical protein
MKLIDYVKTLADGGYLLKTAHGYVYVVVRTRECETEYSRKFFLKVIKKHKHAIVIDAEKCRYGLIYRCEDYPGLCGAKLLITL